MNKIKKDSNEKMILNAEAEWYSKGYTIGLTRGYSKGYSKEYTKEYAKGFAVGYAEGKAEERLNIAKAFGMSLSQLEEIIQKNSPIKN